MTDEKITRRGFVGALAGGLASAASVAAAARAAAAAAAAPAAKGTRRPTPAPSAAGGEAPTAAVRTEIRNQKKYVAQALAKVRAYELPLGSDVAFVFRAKRTAPRAAARRGEEGES